MTDCIDPAAVALSLMREALGLLDDEHLAPAVRLLERAIEATEKAGTSAADAPGPLYPVARD